MCEAIEQHEFLVPENKNDNFIINSEELPNIPVENEEPMNGKLDDGISEKVESKQIDKLIIFDDSVELEEEKCQSDITGNAQILNENVKASEHTTNKNFVENEPMSIQDVQNSQDENGIEVLQKIVGDSQDENIEPLNEDNKNEDTENISHLKYDWKEVPKMCCFATEEFSPTELYENYTKGCLWSPDGTCLLVSSEDYRMRVYELPREFYTGKISKDLEARVMKPALTVKDGGIIYDYCWYPGMNSWKPETCCFLSTSKESPTHLWDAFDGTLRATYRAYNQVDEVEAAISCQFVNSDEEIWCGFKNYIRTFYTDRPGRQVETISFKTSFPNISGLVSCIRENPVMPGLVAFGTYSKHIGLYKDGPLCSFKTGNGVTQIEFSPCGMKLYSASRRSHEFLCWDLRNPGEVLWSSDSRQSNTNQRIQFSVSYDGLDIASGGTDGFVNVWKDSFDSIYLVEDKKPNHRIQVSKDCVNGVSLHKSLPFLATCSGQRLCEDEISIRDNGVKIWYCSNLC